MTISIEDQAIQYARYTFEQGTTALHLWPKGKGMNAASRQFRLHFLRAILSSPAWRHGRVKDELDWLEKLAAYKGYDIVEVDPEEYKYA